MAIVMDSQPASRAVPEPTPAEGPHVAPRLIYVDQLRVLIVVGVFLIHVCEVFNPWDQWHITNPQRSRVLGEVVVVPASWIMPLFMLLAGMSAWYSLQRRSNAAYLRERVVRILLPLLVGTLTLVPVQVWLERRLDGSFQGSLFAFYPHFFDGIYPRGNFSWHHLWFLAHLFLYSVIALPLFRYWQRHDGGDQLRLLSRVSSGPGGLLWLALPLILERHVLWWLFPERHMLTADWSNHALLFVAYVYGFVLANGPWLGAAVDAQWRWALAGAVGITAALVAATWHGLLPDKLPPPYTPGYLVFWSLYAIGAWSWMVAALGLARRWLTAERPLFRYGRRRGYGWYLVHQPIIVAFAFLIVQRRAPLVVKVVTLLLLSAAGTLAGAEALRYAPFVHRTLGLRPETRGG